MENFVGGARFREVVLGEEAVPQRREHLEPVPGAEARHLARPLANNFIKQLDDFGRPLSL